LGTVPRKVKICGIKTPEIARLSSAHGADMIGVVFFKKSPRNIDFKTAAEIKSSLHKNSKIVAVTVNPDDEFIDEMLKAFKPDLLQLHGSETRERVLEIKEKYGLSIIKAISLENPDDTKKAEIFSDIADYILFDSTPPKNSELPGGNSLKFNWNILKDHNVTYNWILSGGLNPDNIDQAKTQTKAVFFDVSSGIESSSGIKDIALIKKFIDSVKN